MRYAVLPLVAVVLCGSADSARAQKTQIAILVDVSGSTKHFESQILDEAKKFVAEQQAAGGMLEVVAFAYGKAEGHFEAVPIGEDEFTEEVENRLGSLKTRLRTHAGGSEGFGRTLEKAFDLDWSLDRDDRRIVLLFGNERFDQGEVSAKDALEDHEDEVAADEKMEQDNPTYRRQVFPVVVHVRFVGPKPEGHDDAMRSWRVQQLTNIQSGAHQDANGAATGKIVAPRQTFDLPVR